MCFKKNLVIVLGLCAAFVFGSCLEVNAGAKSEGSGIMVEYAEYADVQESILSESGETVFLTAVEKVDGIYQAVYQDAASIRDSGDSAVSPQMVVSTEKTVVNTYSNFEDIPEMIYYEEYVNGFNTWMHGYLHVKKTELIGSYWHATYEGKLTGSM